MQPKSKRVYVHACRVYSQFLSSPQAVLVIIVDILLPWLEALPRGLGVLGLLES